MQPARPHRSVGTRSVPRRGDRRLPTESRLRRRIQAVASPSPARLQGGGRRHGIRKRACGAAGTLHCNDHRSTIGHVLSPRPSRAETARGVTADQEAWPASWLSMILHHRDRRSHVSDGEPALSLDCIGWVEASMSPFYIEGDLVGTPVSFSPSVRRERGSQVGCAVLRQEAAVLR